MDCRRKGRSREGAARGARRGSATGNGRAFWAGAVVILRSACTMEKKEIAVSVRFGYHDKYWNKLGSPPPV